jgi:hypothetical protein
MTNDSSSKTKKFETVHLAKINKWEQKGVESHTSHIKK